MKTWEEYEDKLEYGHDFLASSCSNLYKYIDAISGDFWSCKKILSYGRPFNFVLSGRSVGKSTQVACLVLLDYIMNKRRFIYMRRDKDTILETALSFFANACLILNEKMKEFMPDFWIAIKLVGKFYYIAFDKDPETGEPIFQEESIGQTVALSLERKSKSSALGDIYNIIFDEFIERDPTKYLGNAETMDVVEYRAVMSLYHTVDRRVGRAFRNETRVWFLGNTETKFCPLLIKLGISDYMCDGAKFVAPKDKQWVLEMVRGVDALKGREQSFAYQLSTEDEMKYSFSSDVEEDNAFVETPDVMQYIMTLVLQGKSYGLMTDIKSVLRPMHITSKARDGFQTLALDYGSHTGLDYQLIRSWRQQPMLKRMAEFYERGLLTFDKEETKRVFVKYLQFVL